MKLSILDQSPIFNGMNAEQALKASIELAKVAEQLKYHRYWIAEHHDLPGLASSAPEVMLGIIGAQTNRIRIGSGAILLPHYKPYKVAEVFNLLATLYPNRVDLGVGRAPGGSAEASIALSGNFLENVKQYPTLFDELLHFIYNDFPQGHRYEKVKASPIPLVSPQVWMLGTSVKSAHLAAEQGTGYVFGHFMSHVSGKDAVKTYRNSFIPKNENQKPYVIVTVSVICAKTTQEVESLALRSDLGAVQKAKGELNTHLPLVKLVNRANYSDNDRKIIKEHRDKLIIGNPTEVKQQLLKIKKDYQADEIMIITITDSYERRIDCYRLIAKEIIRND